MNVFAGQVPILDSGSEIITESLSICDYLDQEYPDPPLYPKDEVQKNLDKELIGSYGKIINIYYEALWNKENKTFAEYFTNLKLHLQCLEQELEKRGTFLGGETPKMADYMLWPWAERADAISLVYEGKPFSHAISNRLNQWCQVMQEQEVVKGIETSTDRYVKIIHSYREGTLINYDLI